MTNAVVSHAKIVETHLQ